MPGNTTLPAPGNGPMAAIAPGAGAASTVWLTGLPSAGKTTVGRALVQRLRDAGHAAELLDGDELRAALGRELGFSREDREENVRRIGYVADLLSRNGVTAVCSVISPAARLKLENVSFGANSNVQFDSGTGSVYHTSITAAVPFGPWIADLQQRLVLHVREDARQAQCRESRRLELIARLEHVADHVVADSREII